MITTFGEYNRFENTGRFIPPNSRPICQLNDLVATETVNPNTPTPTVDDVYIHLSRIGTSSLNGTITYYNLFSHPFYYRQNKIEDENVRNCVKALLFLHTLPFSYELKPNTTSFFNSDSVFYKNKGGVEIVPPGYLLLIGGLIWRKNYIKNNHSDPIGYYQGITAPRGYNPLFIHKDGKMVFTTLISSYSMLPTSQNYDVDYSEIVCVDNQPLTEYKLVDNFLKFVENGFTQIINSCELYKVKDENGVQTPDLMYYDDLYRLVNKLKENGYLNNIDNSLKVLNGNENFTTSERVYNFNGNYVLGFVDTSNILYTYFSENNVIQLYYRWLMYGECVTTTIPTNIGSNGIAKEALLSYYNGFSKALLSKDKENKKAAEALNDREEKNSERDFKCELYMSLKNIWDRWLCGYYNQKEQDSTNGRHMFEVKNFFNRNFVFIDSFYTNIYDTLRLNCNALLAQYQSTPTSNSYLGKNVVNHLGSVAASHNAMMFNFPDNVNFAELDEKGNVKDTDMETQMREMFTPMPANRVDIPEYHNKFTVIYTHPANKLDTNDRNKFIPDTFDIWSYDQGTGVAPTPFKTPCEGPGVGAERYSNMNRMGYKVPAFGIAYSKQNNSFWKNIGVDMSNYTVTQQSILAESYIAEKGNSDKKNLVFYGQDIYSIYQSYSYTVTVEMLGDAQIQPLMYFQLMNIPMFRGSYMVIKVEHHMTPGYMTTVFTGVKMSKVQPPYTTAWFNTPDDENYGPPDADMDVSENGEEMTSMEGDRIDIEDNNLSKIINKYINSELRCDTFVYDVYNELNTKKLIKNETIGEMFNEMSSSKDWKANKFRVMPKVTNDWSSLITGATSPKVGDLLFGYHDDKLYGGYAHVAIYLGLHSGHKYVAEGFSVSGDKINETDKKVHIARMENSRFGLKTDAISYFTHCTAYSLAQTEESKAYGIPKSKGKTETPDFEIVVDTSKLRHFTLDVKQNGTSLNHRGNAMDKSVQANLVNLIQNVLDPLYDFSTNPSINLGAVYITSGYRSPEVNASTSGSSKTSQHMVGQAADFQLSGRPVTVEERNKNQLRLVQHILNLEAAGKFEYDQLIIENVSDKYIGNNSRLYPQWIHISYKGDGRNRPYSSGNKLMYMYKDNYYPISPDNVLNIEIQ